MSWLKQLFSCRGLNEDLSDELQQHLEEKIDELVATGMRAEEAGHAARHEFAGES
jgi:uncharacterized protein YoaH (UPF0181 family)